MPNDEPVMQLSLAADAFLTPLRAGEGFMQAEFERLCAALDSCATAWALEDTIPKLGANILVDLFPAAEACASMPFYEDRRAEILGAASRRADLARSCVAIQHRPDID